MEDWNLWVAAEFIAIERETTGYTPKRQIGDPMASELPRGFSSSGLCEIAGSRIL